MLLLLFCFYFLIPRIAIADINGTMPSFSMEAGFVTAEPMKRAFTVQCLMGAPRELVRLEVRFDLDSPTVVMFRRQHEWSLAFHPVAAAGAPVEGDVYLLGTDVLIVNRHEVRILTASDPAKITPLLSERQCDSCIGVLAMGPNSRMWDYWPDISFSTVSLQGNRLHTLISESLTSSFSQEHVAVVECVGGAEKTLCDTEGSVGLVSSSTASDMMFLDRGLGGMIQKGLALPSDEEEWRWRQRHKDEGIFLEKEKAADRYPMKAYHIRFTMHEPFMRVPSALMKAVMNGHNVYEDTMEKWDAIQVRIPVSILPRKTLLQLAELGLDTSSAMVRQEILDEEETLPDQEADTVITRKKKKKRHISAPHHHPRDEGDIVFHLYPQDYIVELQGGRRILQIREFAENDTLEIGSFLLKRFVMHKHAPYGVLLMLHYESSLFYSTMNLLFLLLMVASLARWSMARPVEHLTPMGSAFELAAVPIAFFATVASGDIYTHLRLYRYLLPYFFGFLTTCAFFHMFSISYGIWVGSRGTEGRRKRFLQSSTPAGPEDFELDRHGHRATFYADITRTYTFKMVLCTAIWMMLVGRRSDGVESLLTSAVHLYILFEMIRMTHVTFIFLFQEMFPRRIPLELMIGRLIRGSDNYADFLKENASVLFYPSATTTSNEFMNHMRHYQENQNFNALGAPHMHEFSRPAWLSAAADSSSPPPPASFATTSPRIHTSTGHIGVDVTFMLFSMVFLPLALVTHAMLSHWYFVRPTALQYMRDQEDILDLSLVLIYIGLALAAFYLNWTFLIRFGLERLRKRMQKEEKEEAEEKQPLKPSPASLVVVHSSSTPSTLTRRKPTTMTNVSSFLFNNN